MSNGYELEGRTSQKQRTKRALVEAARLLLDQGKVPTVDEVAAAASISRTTAYRYFPNQSALLLEAQPELTPESMLGPDAPEEPEARLDLVVKTLGERMTKAEPQLRAMLRLSLEEDPPELVFRKGRAIGWIEEAITKTKGLSPAQRTRLAQAIRSAVGIEALVWLLDIAGLSRDEALALQRWSARSLLRAAASDPPPVRRSKRERP